MPILTGTIKDGSEAALAAVLNFVRIGVPGIDTATAYSRDIVSATCNASGVFSATLAGGTWRMRWYESNLSNDLVLAMPSSGGPYNFDDVVVDPGDPFPDNHIRWFNDIQDMLTADSTEWIQGRTLNSYGSDRVRAGWDRILLTDDAATGLVDNGDDVLATQDGFALCVRTWISG